MGKKKEQLRETDSTRKVESIQFYTGNAKMIKQGAVIPIINSKLYDTVAGKFVPMQYGPLDRRLGTTQKDTNCGTCKLNLADCVGHFGFMDLAAPVFHVGFFNSVMRVLHCVCKWCSALLLEHSQRVAFANQIRNKSIDYLKRKALHRQIVKVATLNRKCARCGRRNGIIKKANGAVLKIAHGTAILESDLSLFSTAVGHDREIFNLLPRIKFDVLDAIQVQNIFAKIALEDVPFLLVSDAGLQHPLDLLLTRLPVPPTCIRPSVISEVKGGSTEDDLTVKLSEINIFNEVFRRYVESGSAAKGLCEAWDNLQVHVALYMNSEVSGIPLEMQAKKNCRGFAQRLKGKQGRFRGNLSGKRVDFSGRTVISPDPNLHIDQLGVPIHIAKILTFPEIVNAANIDLMKKMIMNGAHVYPGANLVEDRISGLKRYLGYADKEFVVKHLKAGDIVQRHLIDGDIVLFNRQPSLHKISIMAHRVKVVPGRTFRFNECACTPYNADFDGDEMNIHVPQTYEARAEASVLMGVKSNLITPRSGEPLIAATQDFITGGYLLTHKDSFFSRSEVHRLVAALIDAGDKEQKRICIPPPAILKPVVLWLGKQLVELIIRPHTDTKISLNLRAKNKNYTKNEDLCTNDSYVVIRNNVLLCGVLDKALIGSGSKSNIFYLISRNFNELHAIRSMWRLARIATAFLTNHGFSIGIDDVRPDQNLIDGKESLLRDGYNNCEIMIGDYEQGRLKVQPGCTEHETLEAFILKELSSIRDHAGQVCLKNLSNHNAALIMAICGSKGSMLNISQMIACVGQQSISGHRPPDGFRDRSLPHFERKEKTPSAKGFVQNSFYSGLTPTEFFFHTMAGREGLVDTAVKTAETGYMQRRLVKCIEDLCVNYDGTVRLSSGEIIEFSFGDDGLDPESMEAKDGSPIDFQHVLEHIQNTIPFSWDESSLFYIDEIKRSLYSCTNAKFGNGQHQYFRNKLEGFLLEYIEKTAKYYSISKECKQHADAGFTENCTDCKSQSHYRQKLIACTCLSRTQTIAFVELCHKKLLRAIVEPGSAVGAVAATSIGEPSTQMTLKTFHFAGVAAMNITQGVPRIKEIIDGVKDISTPIVTVALENENDEKLARLVKARIEPTTLGEICEYIEDVYRPEDCFILLKINASLILLFQLEVTVDSIANSICMAKLPVQVKPTQLKIWSNTTMSIRPPNRSDKCSVMMYLQSLKYNISKVIVKGIKGVSRCVIHADDKKGDTYKLLVEGNNFSDVLGTKGVDFRRTNFNNAITVAKVLGIEAARSVIIQEIVSTMENHGISLDRRHVMLLADYMTYRGEVLGITRNGLVKMKESVLLLASFERTMDHLYDAAFFCERNRVSGVSESIILGAPMSVGTGLFKLLQKQPTVNIVQRKSIFENFKLDL